MRIALLEQTDVYLILQFCKEFTNRFWVLTSQGIPFLIRNLIFTAKEVCWHDAISHEYYTWVSAFGAVDYVLSGHWIYPAEYYIFKKKYKRKLILLSYCESLKRLLLTMLMKIDCFQFEQQNPIPLPPLCPPTLKPFVIKSFFPPTEKHNARNSRPPFLMGLSHSKPLSRATKYKLCLLTV